MNTLYIECKMGAAGDMLMAALYELLPDKQGFLDAMNALAPGVRVEALSGENGGITGTHMKVTIHGEEEDHDHHHHHATPGSIAHTLEHLALPEQAKAHAQQVYAAIAQAEAKAHGRPVTEIHFHEVGALDAICDVAGVCYAMELLGYPRVICSPVHVGAGTVRCAHGLLPVPAPATANLLTGVPIYGGEVMGELCTPTGAALLTHFASCFSSMPPMTLAGVGCGLGSRTFDRPNCLRVFLGTAPQGGNGEITELVCCIDDMTAEALSFACQRLLSLGALDVYTTPAYMKKGRAGHELTVLCNPSQEQAMALQVLRLTTSNGLRLRRCGKYFLTPGSREAATPWGSLRLKTAQGFGITHEKPEYEDAAALAAREDLAYQDIIPIP